MEQTKLIYCALFFVFLTRSRSFSIFQKQTVLTMMRPDICGIPAQLRRFPVWRQSVCMAIEIALKMCYHLDDNTIQGGLGK
ncbi:MAG: hypothetical protein IKH90_01740, partial [Ruminococcus sp.]|nr:hypothetical protein [Ruminococcus sp.]